MLNFIILITILSSILNGIIVNGEKCDGSEFVYFYENDNYEGTPNNWSQCGLPIENLDTNFVTTNSSNSYNNGISNLTDNFVPKVLSVRMLGVWGFGWEIAPRQCYDSYFLGLHPNGTRCIKRSEMLPGGNDHGRECNYCGTKIFGGCPSQSSLFFLEKEDFQGKFIWICNEYGGSVWEDPLPIHSFIRFSNDNYLIYSERDYQGEMKCFCATEKLNNGTVVPLPRDSEVRKQSIDEIIVGSVKKDLEGVCTNNCLEQ